MPVTYVRRRVTIAIKDKWTKEIIRMKLLYIIEEVIELVMFLLKSGSTFYFFLINPLNASAALI